MTHHTIDPDAELRDMAEAILTNGNTFRILTNGDSAHDKSSVSALIDRLMPGPMGQEALFQAQAARSASHAHRNYDALVAENERLRQALLLAKNRGLFFSRYAPPEERAIVAAEEVAIIKALSPQSEPSE